MNNPKHNPPGWARRLFLWYCNEAVAEDLVGDMDELFFKNLKSMSFFKARVRYIFQIGALIFSSGIRKRKRNFNDAHGTPTYHSFAMYRSYSTIAFRNLVKQKGFSLINMVCLSVGMSVGLLALAVWIDVLEVDNFHTRAANIYRITTQVDDANEKRIFASAPAPLAEKVNDLVPGIVKMVRMEKNFNPEVVQSANTRIPFYGYFASAEFFNVFTFPLMEGNPQRALEKPFSIVLTQSAAEKLFRDVSPLGKVLEVKGLGNFEVTGVIKDFPRTHLYFEVLASYSTMALLEQQGKIKPSLQDWGPFTDHYAYVLVDDDKAATDLRQVIEKIPAPTPASNPTIKAQYSLQPFTAIAMSDLSNEIGLSWGDLSLYIFFFLALLVLVPACFNYANIAIARALKRAKEIGLRKVAGGESRHIFFQIVMETVILSVLSLTGAILIFMSVREGFLSMVVSGHDAFSLEITPFMLVVFLLFGIGTGILAGVFPAIYFSRLNPIETLRNSSASGNLSKISIRKGLIVFQFMLSLFFILSVAIVFKQYRYAINYDMGFQKENILDIPLQEVDQNRLEAELKKLPEVSSLSMSSSIPGNWSVSSVWLKPDPGADSLEVYQMFVSHGYLENLGLTMIAGVGFPEAATGHEESIIVNETLLTKFNLGSPFDALNKSLRVGNQDLRISGVVKDFNYMPLREEIQNFFFRNDPAQFRYANVKLKSTDIQATLEKIAQSWKIISDQKFEARFLDDEVEESLVSYRSMIKIFGFLGLLAVTISCLGLLAVVISTAESRTKEMGIRKIMGASMADLALSLSRNFLKLIGIAILIGTPLTYFIFDKLFLRISFYRAAIGASEISLGILLLLILTSVIIGSQTLKVARINPVDTLKYE